MLAEAGEEECLVDSTVEDRDAQLEALGNHVSPLQPRLTCQLGGRQVICHFDPHPPSRTFTCHTVCLLRRMLSRRATAGRTAPRPRGHPRGRPSCEISANSALRLPAVPPVEYWTHSG